MDDTEPHITTKFSFAVLLVDSALMKAGGLREQEFWTTPDIYGDTHDNSEGLFRGALFVKSAPKFHILFDAVSRGSCQWNLHLL